MLNINRYGLLVLLVGCSFVCPIQAAELDLELKVCQNIAKDAARLNCYDDLVGKVITVSDNTKVELSQAKVIAPSISKVDEFGKDHMKVKSSDNTKLESVVFTIDELKKLNYDNWQLTFKNGQVWRQKDSIRIKFVIGDLVKLSRGFGSAVYLQKVDSNRRVKVKRVK